MPRPRDHFLVSNVARDLPLAKVLRMDEEEAYTWFLKARWPQTNGEPFCPECGCIGAYALTRRRFRCRAKECRNRFTVTSGTILAHHKLSFVKMLAIIAFSVTSVKGKAAAKLCREIDCDYKTAFVMLHKLREAVAAEREHLRLDGTVEMDAMYAGGHVRPENRKEDRQDRRLAENRNPDRRCVMVMRQRVPEGTAQAPGQDRSVVGVFAGEENPEAVWHLVRNHARRPVEFRADQHGAYDVLDGLFDVVRNNHDRAYVEARDASTNHAESIFSRFRRSLIGIHHRMSPKYVDWYMADLAWREDMRRTTMASQAKNVLALAMGHPVSRNIKGYWDERRPKRLVGWNPMAGYAGAG